MSSRRLFKCVRHNHPWAKIYAYYEEQDGMVQKVKIQDDGSFGGYEGMMFPFDEIADAVIELNYNAPDREQVGVLMSKVTPRNNAQSNGFFTPDDEDEFQKSLDT